MDETLQIKLSAWCDGELDGAGRAEIERMLAGHPEWSATAAQFRRLDAAAAALPVPHASGELHSPVELEDALRQPLSAQLTAGVAEAPLIAPERFAKVWASIVARVEDLQTAHQSLAAKAQQDTHVPAVSTQQWERVWNGIQRGVASRTTGSLPVNLPEGQPNGSGAASHTGRVVRTTRWRWFSAAGIAAMLVGALAVHYYYNPPAPTDNMAAIELASTSDNDRYEISVEYSPHGESVVCYYLKPEARGNDTDSDWRWLPD